MRIELLLTLSIFAFLCVPALGQVETVEYWLMKGAKEYGNGSFEEALDSFDNATAVDSQNATVWFARGLAQSALNRHEEAISSYNKSIQIDPEDIISLSNRARALQDLKRYEEAVKAYDDVLALNSTDPAAWYNRGLALGSLGRYDEGLQSFEESIKIYPNSPSPWYGKAAALRSLGRTQEAEEAWTRYQDLSYAHISFSDNSGESMKDAIVIMNATGEDDGVGSEYYYLEKRFGRDAVRWGDISQSLVGDETDRSYDVLEVPLTTGETVTIYFDITDFYGKEIREMLEAMGL